MKTLKIICLVLWLTCLGFNIAYCVAGMRIDPFLAVLPCIVCVMRYIEDILKEE